MLNHSADLRIANRDSPVIFNQKAITRKIISPVYGPTWYVSFLENTQHWHEPGTAAALHIEAVDGLIEMRAIWKTD
jgi:hypothetical protein